MRSTPPNADRDALRLGILLSGRGSNFQAIAASIREGRLKGTEIAVVISNVAEAGGIALARHLGFATAVLISNGRTRSDHDAAVAISPREHSLDLACHAPLMILPSPH